ncbi:LysR substrate-binding domain-containing protein [Rhizobium leguminosarum]|uniref:LysR family transcriptional regulator n=1 Tax=Rhizobium leguminosarum TaxID=384 RepID=A0A7K3VSN3_RHILE|nr:LysR substrate-binding domain-containing protein [Rhizobium leguminosarum]NEK19894.1 LysR family transcriptional regulator [Rhizobium leguminosarum]
METKSDHPNDDEYRWMRRGIPPWAVLTSFMEVVSSGSVTKTAKRLYLTQSAVSHHISQLERFVGERLFERSGKTMKPTAKARALAFQLRSQLRSVSEALEAARLQLDQHDLHIVVAPEFYRYWLARRLDVFVASHPHISLRLSQDYRREIFSDGKADVQIRLARPLAEQDGFPLSADHEFAVCSPELVGRLPRQKAFAAAPFLSHADAYQTKLDWRRWMLELFGIEGARWIDERLAAMVIFPTFEDMLKACRGGEGFALVRTILVVDEIASGRLVKAVTETLSADVNYHVIYQSGVALRPAAQQFVQWLRSETAEFASREVTG